MCIFWRYLQSCPVIEKIEMHFSYLFSAYHLNYWLLAVAVIWHKQTLPSYKKQDTMMYTKQHHLDHMMLVGHVDENGTLHLTKEDMQRFLSCPPRVSRKNFFNTMMKRMHDMNPLKAYAVWKHFKNNKHLYGEPETKSMETKVSRSAARYVAWKKRVDHAKSRDDSDALARLMLSVQEQRAHRSQ